MKVTAQEEYGLRCMLGAASSSPDKPVTVSAIAQSERISVAYASKLLNLLREAHLVESLRGRSGGYYIARPAEQITLSEILAALGGHIFEPEYCDRFPGEEDSCVHMGDCSLRSLWGTLEGIVEQVLTRTTLADLLTTEKRASADLMHRQRRSLPMLPGPLAGPGRHALTTDRITTDQKDE